MKIDFVSLSEEEIADIQTIAGASGMKVVYKIVAAAIADQLRRVHELSITGDRLEQARGGWLVAEKVLRVLTDVCHLPIPELDEMYEKGNDEVLAGIDDIDDAEEFDFG